MLVDAERLAVTLTCSASTFSNTTRGVVNTNNFLATFSLHLRSDMFAMVPEKSRGRRSGTAC
jgi:hypothetical protein